jgi:hypothetical protein
MMLEYVDDGMHPAPGLAWLMRQPNCAWYPDTPMEASTVDTTSITTAATRSHQRVECAGLNEPRSHTMTWTHEMQVAICNP